MDIYHVLENYIQLEQLENEQADERRKDAKWAMITHRSDKARITNWHD